MSSKRILVFRLSSFGDVVLAATALESTLLKASDVHWVVGTEFADLLSADSRISELHAFNRQEQGLISWVELNIQLAKLGFAEVHDLHGSIRTKIARLIFFVLAPRTRWKTVSKYRFRTLLVVVFKQWIPRLWVAPSWRERFGKATGGTGAETPDLRGLIRGGRPFNSNEKNGICIMPSSKWRAKEWPIQSWVELCRSLSGKLVILGTSRDEKSNLLFDTLYRIYPDRVFRIKGDEGIRKTALALAGAELLISVDTGLAHLAEALGTPVVMIFGPTTPQLGFGPWRGESKVVSSNVWCSPCGKSGSRCWRPFRRYECLNLLPPQQVLDATREICGP